MKTGLQELKKKTLFHTLLFWKRYALKYSYRDILFIFKGWNISILKIERRCIFKGVVEAAFH